MISDGWIPYGRSVHGEHFNYLVIGKQLLCKTCRTKSKNSVGNGAATIIHKFQPWHPGVLRQLPRDLLELFPAVMLGRSAVDLALITRVEQAHVTSIGVATLAGHIKENHWW